MTDVGNHAPTRRPTHVPERILAVATAALLAVDAVVHLHDAHLYDAVSSPTLSEGTLFRAEAVAAIVVGIALLIRPHPLVWTAAALLAAAAAGAVLLYRYVDVGAVGPLPDMYEPSWAVPGKRGSAVAETAATLLALTGLALALARRRTGTLTAAPTGRGRR
jgi:hypothetical protein